MQVKICGITDVATALGAVQAGADALGFVFARSKRKISPEAAKKIIEALPKTTQKVGIFVNEKKETIEEIAAFTGLTALQLHGDEPPKFCRQFSLPVIKALSIKEKKDLERIDLYPCKYILLDSPRGKYHGGNGVNFDWDMVSGTSFPDKLIILAGGLTEDNVLEAIHKVKPFMVDVSSGVETAGKKDLDKIQRFIQKVKGYREGV